jgi:hypothetical protein
MDNADLVAVFTAPDATRAEIIKGFLESEGIRCFLDGEQTAGLLIPAFEVNIMVPAADADHARHLIEAREEHRTK